jgi:hypothetical protein
MSTNKNRKRLVVAGAAAFVAFGAVVASAAGLGGITSGSVGADTTVVASCDTDGVAVAYTTTYDATSRAYQVTGVTVSGVADGCSTQNLAVTLSNNAGTALANGSATVAGNSVTVALSNSVDAKALRRVAVVIAS